MSADADDRPVLILGAGVNGCALARELAVNGVSVVLVEKHDVAFGASSKSSRLIHGGLRYLEYGEFDLVRESLRERTRLLRLAPQFVRPVRLYVPVRSRLGGLAASIRRFLRMTPPKRSPARGEWLVRAGLTLYDAYARDKTAPKHAVHELGADSPSPKFDPERYRRSVAYTDGRILDQERFVLAMLADAEDAAKRTGARFHLCNGSRLTELRVGDRGELSATVRPDGGDPEGSAIEEFRPSAVVNATGAWGDLTLGDDFEGVLSSGAKYFGGTKGSHVFTRNAALHEALRGGAVYAEADDGRMVFVLPQPKPAFAAKGDVRGSIMIGTTDIPFEGDPSDAAAEDDEARYLVDLVNELFPQVGLSAEDVEWTYSGVRPLPASDAKTPGAVTRRHLIRENELRGGAAVLTLVGGKWTTCREFGEQIADRLFELTGRKRTASTRDLVYAGGENYPKTPEDEKVRIDEIAGRLGRPLEQVAAVWALVGTRTEDVLASDDDRSVVAGTNVPRTFARYAIREEYVTRLEDLVERRLALLDAPTLSRETLGELCDLLIEANKLAPESKNEAIEACVERLRTAYAKPVD